MDTGRTKLDMTDGIMLIDTKAQQFDMQAIENRRFMFNPDTGRLVLGKYTPGDISYSHAEELGKSGVKEPYDAFIRGWVGTNAREYKNGVIHFAPNIDGKNIEYFNRGFDTLLMFRENNANGKTVVRGFGSVWEQALSKVLEAPARDAEQRASVLGQLKAERPPQAVQQSKATSTEKER